MALARKSVAFALGMFTVCAALFGSVDSAHALTYPTGAGWSASVAVRRVEIDAGTGRILVYFDTSASGEVYRGTCTENPTAVIADATTANASEIFSLVLAAQLSGRKIHFYSDNACRSSRPTTKFIALD